MNIELKRLNEIDPGQLAYNANDIRVSQYLRNSFPYPYTVIDAMQFIQLTLHSDQQLHYAIVVNGVCAGCISVTFQNDIYVKNCELGYWLGVDYWNQGIISHVIPMMCDFLFQNYPITKIYAEVFSENITSCHVLEKCGFIKEGHLKKHIYKNQQYYDAVIYSLLGE